MKIQEIINESTDLKRRASANVKHKLRHPYSHDAYRYIKNTRYQSVPKFKITKDLREEENSSPLIDEVRKFAIWVADRIHLEKIPNIHLSTDTDEAQTNHHTGGYVDGDNTIWVYARNRNLVDILRTVAHEMTHVRQSEKKLIGPNASYPGSPIEAHADVIAGTLIKLYGKTNNHIFQ